MSDELEKSLRVALRPVDPGEEFTQSVLARAAADSHAGGAAKRRYPLASRSTLRWSSALLAIVLSVGLFTAHKWQQHRTQQGLEARRQLFQALHLAGANLDIAYRMVNDQEQAGAGH